MKKMIAKMIAVCLIICMFAIPVSAATLDHDDWKWSWDWNKVVNWFEDYGKNEVNDVPPAEIEEPEEPEIEETEPVVEEYTIRYDANGGYWWSQYASPAISNSKTYTVESGNTHKIISAPIRTGHTFKGWEDADGNIYQPGDKITPTANMSFKAVWG